ncbi:MAG: phosphotransferase [bacterium]
MELERRDALQEPPKQMLDLKCVADVAGVRPSQVASRETIRALPRKVTERIELLDGPEGSHRVALLKWGPSQSLRRELLLYSAVYDPDTDPVPRLLGRFVADDRQVLLLEWVWGEVPDVSSRESVERVFHAYGRWMGQWAAALRDYRAGETGPFWRPVPSAMEPDLRRFLDPRITEQRLIEDFERLDDLYAACADLLDPGRGPRERVLFREIAAIGPAAAAAIFSTPATLCPGDLSVKNVLLRGPARRPTFFDFEFAGIMPAAITLNAIGEDSGLVPTGSLAEYAKEKFLGGWSDSAAPPLVRETFHRGQRCAFLHYQCHQIRHFFEDILSDPELAREPRRLEWWRRAPPDLSRLVRSIDLPSE